MSTWVPCRFGIMAHVRNPARQFVWNYNLCELVNRACKYALVSIEEGQTLPLIKTRTDFSSV